jgi:Uma2 family endonuclease
MTSVLTPPSAPRTLAELLRRLGGISPDRVLLQPPPGTATEADVLAVERRENRLCELVDGALVEKVMGYRESLLALALAGFLRGFVLPRNLGLVSGPDGMMRLFPLLVRIPDVAFTAWHRIPGRRVPTEPVPDLVPDLAVEILSEGNTAEEMARKRTEYFAAGVRLVWLIDPASRTVAVYSGPDQSIVVDEAGTLDGAAVLPGFTLPVRDLFAELDRHGQA